MMRMSNSPLVSYTKLSPNHSGKRKVKIDTITPHCVVGHLSLQSLGNVFSSPSRQASSNYGIDDNGRIGMYVHENNRSWCTSSASNDQRAVTIEIASDTTLPYKITNKAMDGLIRLSVDICKRNDIPRLLWRADKTLIGQVDKQNITVHRWFANKSCPGDYVFNRLGEVADEVNKIIVPKPEIVIPNNGKPPYKVRVKADLLNHRKGPGTNFPINGRLKKGDVFTIVEEAYGVGASKWGRSWSGSIWVSLDHCEKLR